MAEEPTRGPRADAVHLYEFVADTLERKIRDGSVQPGSTLRETPLARALSVSRAPVRQAFERLHLKGLIHRHDGQGFVVGGDRENVCASALDHLGLKKLFADDSARSPTRSPAWQAIYEQIRDQVIDCLPFGTYRIHEAAMTRRFDVSRTVTREVIARLADRHLIEKDARSHWIAGPLTARELRESFAMCRILQCSALRIVSADAPPAVVAPLAVRIRDVLASFDAARVADVNRIEERFQRELFRDTGNRRLDQALFQFRLPLTVARIFRQQFGIARDRTELAEQLRVLESLAEGKIERACEALEAFLDGCEKRMMAKLRVISVLPKPRTPDYLVNIG